MLIHGALVKYHLATITHDPFYLHLARIYECQSWSRMLHMFCCFGSKSSECKSHWSYNSSPMKSIGLMRSKPCMSQVLHDFWGLQYKTMMNPIGVLFYFKCGPKSKPREKAICTTYHMVRMSSLLLEWVPFITEWEWDTDCVIVLLLKWAACSSSEFTSIDVRWNKTRTVLLAFRALCLWKWRPRIP